MQLVRLLEACQLLRKVIRFLYLARKLRNSIHLGDRELAKAASCVLELELLRKEADLTGIKIVDNETRWIVKTGEDVLNNASRMLLQGLEIQNQAEVATALQVFYNLGTLKSKVFATLDMLVEKSDKAIHHALLGIDKTVDSQSNKGTAPMDAKSVLWSRLEKMMDTLHNCCVQIWHLQRVLSKIRDPNTHLQLLDILIKPGELTIIQLYWKKLTVQLKNYFENSSKANPIIETTFVTEFPKLYRFFLEFLKRLHNHYEMKQSLGLSVEDEIQLLNSLSQFKASYLHRSFSRLYEAVNKVFSLNSIPTSEEIINIASIVTNELEISKMSAVAMLYANDIHDLSDAVARGIAKGLTFFASKIEQMIAHDSSAYQFGDSITPTQLRNAKLFNALYQLHRAIANVVQAPTTTRGVEAALNPPLQQLYQVSKEITTPLMEKMVSTLEQVLQGMHNEDFGSNEIPTGEAQACSAYMSQLQNQIRQYQSIILSKYTPGSWMNRFLENLSSRIIVYFVRSISLIRPLGEAGKLKVATDMAQMEYAIAPLKKANQLGNAYQILRAFRPFMFQEINTIQNLENNQEINILPPSIVLHHLFSRASPSLKSPHVVQNWSVGTYIGWMELHSEEEIWQLIKMALSTYASQVNAKGDKEFDPMYPILSSLGPKLLQQYKQKM